MNRPLSGGLKIVRVAGHNVEVGSIGVIVRRHNVLGFVTAGHVAGSINERIFQPRHSDTNYVGKTKHVSNYTGTANSDSAFVEIEGAQANEGAIWKDDQSFYSIMQTGVAQANVIMSGQNNNDGAEAGTVVVADATVRFAGGGTLNHQVITNYLTQEGDSGAPVFRIVGGNNVELFGINVGGSAGQYIQPAPGQPPNQHNGLYGVYSTWAHVKSDLGGGSWSF